MTGVKTGKSMWSSFPRRRESSNMGTTSRHDKVRESPGSMVLVVSQFGFPPSRELRE
ncbi:hypothetical protein [Endozoicomonas sp. ALB060]|uniref:hypothetical protein n=1 Tax=Endozoicomonas sp. ALB060 TaxID=3403072 RepID=UPI003BB6F853